MMAPDYAHWHGMYEVAERFYQELIPQAREIADHAAEANNKAGAEAVEQLIHDILARPEHEWFEKGKLMPDVEESAAVEPAAEEATDEEPSEESVGEEDEVDST